MTHPFAVCILFYQKLEQTIECVNSFSQGPVIVYVLNNGSDEQSFIELKSRFTNHNNILFFDAGENLGPARGRNYLIAKVIEPWIVFADNDITVRPINWAELLLSKIASKPDIEIFLPRLFNVHENEYAHFFPFHLKDNQVYDSYIDSEKAEEKNELNWFPSGASIVRKDFFNEMGVFDNNLFAFEDYEMGIRCLKMGKKLSISSISAVTFVHDHKFQTLKRDKNAVLQRYNTQKLQNSFMHIERKFNIKLNHDWQYWTNSQVSLMTKSKKKKLINKIVSKLSKVFK